jgi:hypothetical protein
MLRSFTHFLIVVLDYMIGVSSVIIGQVFSRSLPIFLFIVSLLVIMLRVSPLSLFMVMRPALKLLGALGITPLVWLTIRVFVPFLVSCWPLRGFYMLFRILTDILSVPTLLAVLPIPISPGLRILSPAVILLVFELVRLIILMRKIIVVVFRIIVLVLTKIVLSPFISVEVPALVLGILGIRLALVGVTFWFHYVNRLVPVDFQ